MKHMTTIRIPTWLAWTLLVWYTLIIYPRFREGLVMLWTDVGLL